MRYAKMSLSLKSPWKSRTLFAGTRLRHIPTDAHERVISLPSVARGTQTEMGRELLRIQTSGRKKANQTETRCVCTLAVPRRSYLINDVTETRQRRKDAGANSTFVYVSTHSRDTRGICVVPG